MPLDLVSLHLFRKFFYFTLILTENWQVYTFYLNPNVSAKCIHEAPEFDSNVCLANF